jgi:hypothetical protein
MVNTVSNKEVYNSICKVMNKYSSCLFGIADISYSAYSGNYKRAVVIAVPQKRLMTGIIMQRNC